jgi:predicted esterase
MRRLAASTGSGGWILVSIQGLHRFYNRKADRIVASWMTRQDRELAIPDNIAYVSHVLSAVVGADPTQCGVFAGFSQGAAMAYRSAVMATARRRHVIAVGGDIPPELDAAQLAELDSVLICRGAEDTRYRCETFDADVRLLKAAGIPFEAHVVAGGHEWPQDVIKLVTQFLQERCAPGETDRFHPNR